MTPLPKPGGHLFWPWSNHASKSQMHYTVCPVIPVYIVNEPGISNIFIVRYENHRWAIIITCKGSNINLW